MSFQFHLVKYCLHTSIYNLLASINFIPVATGEQRLSSPTVLFFFSNVDLHYVQGSFLLWSVRYQCISKIKAVSLYESNRYEVLALRLHPSNKILALLVTLA